eukprot:EG_transcript_9476
MGFLEEQYGNILASLSVPELRLEVVLNRLERKQRLGSRLASKRRFTPDPLPRGCRPRRRGRGSGTRTGRRGTEGLRGAAARLCKVCRLLTTEAGLQEDQRPQNPGEPVLLAWPAGRLTRALWAYFDVLQAERTDLPLLQETHLPEAIAEAVLNGATVQNRGWWGQMLDVKFGVWRQRRCPPDPQPDMRTQVFQSLKEWDNTVDATLVVVSGGRLHEGHMSREQQEWLIEFLQQHDSINVVVEVGFNAGHSAHAMLAARAGVVVHTFDTFAHPYSLPLARVLLDRYPTRFFPHMGRSQNALGSFPLPGVGLFLIDGSHRLADVEADIANARAMAGPGSFIVCDDILPNNKRFGVGPAAAWDRAVADRHVVELERHASRKHAWVLGSFILPTASSADVPLVF